MELQWPLILFTTLGAASAGVFATQGIYAILGKGQKAQLPALITSVVLLAVAGIAVFFHLQHWERIFNGFGHLSSGITQELIAIVVMVIVMVVYFAMLRREGQAPKWAGILAVVISAILVVIMGMSYMMAARPAWDNILQILSLIGYALAVGAGVFALLDASVQEDAELHGLYGLVGTIVNAVCTLGFVFMMSSAANSFTNVGNYFDPNHPTVPMSSATDYSPFSGDAMAFTVCAIILALAAVAFAVFGKQSKKWTIAGAGTAVCALIGAALLRAVFFACGGSVFMFY